jgi:hypothetical protein
VKAFEQSHNSPLADSVADPFWILIEIGVAVRIIVREITHDDCRLSPCKN